jgi:hypothetical protein
MLPTSVHVWSTYASCGWFPYVATFHEPPTELDGVTAPEKNGSRHNSQHADWPIRGSVSVSLSSQPMKQWRKSNIHQQQATRFTGSISPACDWYVQYLLMGANRMILNRHRRGLQPWRCRFATYPLPTFPTSCLPFPLVAPPGLQFNQVPAFTPSAEF